MGYVAAIVPMTNEGKCFGMKSENICSERRIILIWKRWQVPVNTAMNLTVSQKVGVFLIVEKLLGSQERRSSIASVLNVGLTVCLLLSYLTANLLP